MNPWIRDPDEFSEADQLEADYHILFRTIGPQDYIQYFASSFEYVKHRALIAYRKETYSYRGFKVGCAVLAHNGETIRAYFRTAVFSEGNLKKRPHDIKLCAERRSIMKAQRAGYPNIAGMVIVGKRQADEDSLLVTRTLHSCLACRTFFSSTPGITNQTVIVTFEPDEEIMEVMTVEELLKLHQTAELS